LKLMRTSNVDAIAIENENEEFDDIYLEPLPVSLSAPSLDGILKFCYSHALKHGYDVVRK